jgi:DNA ligase-1
MQLPTLFKKTSTGAQQEWAIWTEGNVICTRWGQTGGAMQTGRDVIKEGKNAGKKNATTPEQQAELEARSLWEKKKKKGYHENADAAMAGEVDALVEGGIFPMLAHRYDQHGHKIKWPAFAQPKLDGHRCIVVVKRGKASMWSRTRKPITGVPHIARAFEDLIEGDAIFDGELYNHSFRDKFEELTSFIRQEEPKEGHEVVQYHIYDCPWTQGGFGDRYEVLREFFEAAATMHNNPDAEAALTMVETIKVASEDELMTAFENFTKQGYEGAMVRNIDGPYAENKRSYDLLKVKEFIDDEFEVVGIEEGRGKLAGHAIFVCQMKDGQEFRAKMIGELEQLKKYVKNPKLAIGKKLTVKYQGLTKANGVPRFPVAVRFRQDI